MRADEAKVALAAERAADRELDRQAAEAEAREAAQERVAEQFWQGELDRAGMLETHMTSQLADAIFDAARHDPYLRMKIDEAIEAEASRNWREYIEGDRDD